MQEHKIASSRLITVNLPFMFYGRWDHSAHLMNLHIKFEYLIRLEEYNYLYRNAL